MSSNLRSPFRAAGLVIVALACAALVLSQTAPGVAVPLQQGGLHRLYITDVRDDQFVVSWTTDTASDGQVEWGTTTALGNSTADTVSSTTTHYVHITELSLNVTYYFQVRSGTLVDNNGGSYYTVTTGPTLRIPPTGKLVYGYVYQSSGTTPVNNAVVYLQIQDANGAGSPGSSQWVTARTTDSGVWFYNNLSEVRKSDAGAYFAFSDLADNLSLVAQGGNLGTTTRIVVVPGTYPTELTSLNLDAVPNAVTLSAFTANANTGLNISLLLIVIGFAGAILFARVVSVRASRP